MDCLQGMMLKMQAAFKEAHQPVGWAVTLLAFTAAFREAKTRVMACAPASLVSAARSAPTYPGVFAATAAKSNVPSNLILLARTCTTSGHQVLTAPKPEYSCSLSC